MLLCSAGAPKGGRPHTDRSTYSATGRHPHAARNTMNWRNRMIIPLRVLRWGVLLLAISIIGAAAPSMAAEHRSTRQVVVPQEDRFTPFALTIHAGDTVQWVN